MTKLKANKRRKEFGGAKYGCADCPLDRGANGYTLLIILACFLILVSILIKLI